MLAWKIAPALAAGNTVVLKPAETTPLTALLFAEVCQQADLPAGVVNIVTGAGDTGQALVEHPDVDKIAFTGSTEVGKAIARTIAGTGKKATLELGGKAANIVFDDAADRPGRRGHRQRHLLQPGPRLLRRVAPARAGERPRRGRSRKLKRRLADAARRRPARQEHRPRRDQLARAARPHPRARPTAARPRAPSGGARACELPSQGLLVPADGVHRRLADAPDRPGGDLRAGPVGADLPHPAGGGRQGQQHALRPVGRRLDREGLAHPLDGRPAAGRRRVGQHLQPLRPDLAVRRLQGVRATAARAAATAWRPTSRLETASEPHGDPQPEAPPRRAQDLQALHRRRVPAQRVRPLLRGRSADAAGQFLANAVAGLAQGRPRRGRRRARRVRGLGGRDGVQPRPGALPRRRGARGPPRPVRRRGARRPRASPRARAGAVVDAAIDRVGLVRRVDRQDRPGARRPQPGRRAVLQHLGARADRRRRACWRRRPPRCSGSCRVVAPVVVVGQHRASSSPASDRPLPAVTLSRGARDVATCRAASSTSSPAAPPRSPPGSPRTATSTRSTSPVSPAPTGVDWAALEARRGRQPQAGAAPRRQGRRAPSSPTGPPTPDLSRIRAFVETKTVWHPKGR